EYVTLGSMGALSGLFLASLFTSLLGHFVFEFTFIPPPGPMIGIFFFVTGVTVMMGLFNSRNIIRQSPLEVLRKEA
ncbi:MAG: hypothetical protein OEY56_06940, partial [Cyclobacteriaceae bacterium]|nr:hypothetical protein [Cyclobacteriaceae bacterium]